MDNAQTLRALIRDDAYQVVRVLADGPSGRTELVTLDGEGPLVRKSIPLELANPAAWALAMNVEDELLPRVESLYRLPDKLVVLYEYVPGESLKELMERGELGDERQRAGYVCDVCHAVACLHAEGVLHRDITPANVVVGEGRAHLVDLGIARQQKRDAHRDTTTLGTWGYAAPEQFGFAQTDPRSDIYAIGRLLGYLLTGVVPSSPDFDQELDHVATESGVRGSLAIVARYATAFEPSGRYQSAEELADAVRVALELGNDASAASRAVLTPAPSNEEDAAPDSSGAEVAGVVRQRGDTRLSQATQGKAGVLRKLWLRVGGPRRAGDIPFLLRMADLVVLFGGLYSTGILILLSTNSISGSEKPWGVAERIIAIAIFVGLAGLSAETHRAVTLWGPYEHALHRFPLYLRRVIIFEIITFGVLMVLTMVLPWF